MTRPAPNIVFETLTKTKHYTDENYNAGLFDTTSPSHSSYWQLSDLYNLYGAPYIPELNKDTVSDLYSGFTYPPIKIPNTIKKPRCAEHIIPIYNTYSLTDPYGTKKVINGPDFKLSQYACWNLLKQWGNLIFSQLYFIFPNKNYEELKETSHHFSRVYLRKNLAKAERSIQGIAHKNHIDQKQLANNLHRAFFYSSDIDSIKEHFNIPRFNSDPIANYMTAYSMHAKLKALNNAIQKHDNNPNLRFATFNQILIQELQEARQKVIHRTGITPEQSITSIPVSKVESELRFLELNFIKNSNTLKIR